MKTKTISSHQSKKLNTQLDKLSRSKKKLCLAIDKLQGYRKDLQTQSLREITQLKLRESLHPLLCIVGEIMEEMTIIHNHLNKK
jgi:hypothetical protein